MTCLKPGPRREQHHAIARLRPEGNSYRATGRGHTSSTRTQRRSSIDFSTASITWVILWPKAKSGSAGRPSAIAQISSRASMIFWSL